MFATGADAKAFILAGKAILTLTSDKTGNHYTYRVTQAINRATGEAEPRWFVGVLTGPDNTRDYTYLGMLADDALRLTKASKFAADSLPVRAFAYAWKHFLHDALPTDCAVEHCGHCGRCGRLLTTPESLATGLGSDCAAILGVPYGHT